MNLTPIEWTDFSANPLKYRDADGRVVWACVHASPGCRNCYAEGWAKRLGKGGPFNVPTTNKATPFLDEKELRKILTADRIGKQSVAGSMIFIGDMTDVAGPWVPDDMLDVLLALALVRQSVVIQILTKRIERICARMRTLLDETKAARRYFRPAMVEHAGVCLDSQGMPDLANYFYGAANNLAGADGEWPSNLWIGASAEDQQRYDERVGHLSRTPAAVRFWSLEPLLGPTDMRMGGKSLPDYSPHNPLPDVDWVIVGGESGPGARPCDVRWVRRVVEQCRDARVPCFVKQLGTNVRDRNDAGFDADSHTWADGPDAGEPVDSAAWPDRISEQDRVEHNPNGHREEYQGAPVRIHLSKKGGDPSEWPKDLRVREFPRSAVPA